MKIIQRFVLWLSAGTADAKTSEPPVLEKADGPPPKIAPESERVSFSDDDSPPGYKIRWHH